MDDISKRNNKKVCFVLFLFLTIMLVPFKTTSEEVEVKLHVSIFSHPYKNVSINAKDYTVAIEKILTGEFSKEDFDEEVLNQLRLRFKETTNKSFQLNEDLYIGNKQINKKKNLTEILYILKKNNLWSVVNHWNEREEPYTLPFQSKNLYDFTKKNDFTDIDGNASALLDDEKDYVIMDPHINEYGMQYFQFKNQRNIVINVRPKSEEPISANIIGLPEVQENHSGNYSVNVGETFVQEVCIKVPPALSTAGNSLTIDSQPNLEFQSIEIDGKPIACDQKIAWNPTFDINQENSFSNFQRIFTTKKDAQFALEDYLYSDKNNKYINHFVVNLDPFILSYSGRTMKVKVKFKVVSVHNIKGIRIKYQKNEQEKQTKVSIQSKLNKNKSLKSKFEVDFSGQKFSCISNIVSTTMNNFIVYDGKDGKFVEGTTFYLGRISKDGEISFFEGNTKKHSPIWNNSNTKIKDVKNNGLVSSIDAQLIRHLLNQSSKHPFKFISGRDYSLDHVERSEKRNVGSTFRLFGLSFGYTYILIPGEGFQNIISSFVTGERQFQDFAFQTPTFDNPMLINEAIYIPQDVIKSDQEDYGNGKFNTVPVLEMKQEKSIFLMNPTIYLGCILIIVIIIFGSVTLLYFHRESKRRSHSSAP